MHTKIHCNEIYREYERHRVHAEEVEAQLNSVLKNVREKYNVDLEKYAPRLLPVFEAVCMTSVSLPPANISNLLSSFSYRARSSSQHRYPSTPL